MIIFSKKSFIVSWQVKSIHKESIHKEYEHVFKVWNTFQMITMKDYHELYLKCDVLLLAYVFEGK